jgi:hypothetical protein
MPQYTVEFDDKGELVGEAPSELGAIFKRIESTHYGQGYGKGVSKAAEDAKAQIESNVKAEVARLNALAPLEAEKHQRIAEENSILQTRLTELAKESDRTLKQREEAHARQTVAAQDALAKREGRIKDLVKAQIRGEALGYGAREESLSELELILINAIGYDEDMEPFVKDEDGKPRQLHGKAIGLSTYVKQYLDSHPHHRKAPTARGAAAAGGASFHNLGSTVTEAAAKARIESGDRSASAIDDLFKASRQKRAS